MADIFWGELLIFLILIPILLRPFSRRIQSIHSIPVLAPIALLCLLLLIWGQGISVSIILTAIPAILVFLFALPSLIRFISGLPTDWFRNGTKICTVFLAAVTIFCAAVICVWAPGPNTPPENVVVRRLSISGTFRDGFQGSKILKEIPDGAVYVWAPEQETQSSHTVFYLPDIQASARDRRITAELLAEKGYTVVAADFYQSRYVLNGFNSIIIRPFIARFADMFPRIFRIVTDDEVVREKTRELTALVNFWKDSDPSGKNAFGYISNIPEHTDSFIFAEGRAAAAAEIYRALNGSEITGACYALADGVLKDDTSGVFPETLEEEHILRVRFRQSGIPADAGKNTSLLVFGNKDELFGFGDICVLYPADAVLLGSGEDKEHSAARLIASLAGEYYARRSAYLVANTEQSGGL